MASEIARRLRKTMTQQEVKLWVHLRSWRKHGFHFRRQSPRAGYIVDFVCMRHGLIVEIDGGQHNFDEHALVTNHAIVDYRETDFVYCGSGTTRSMATSMAC